mmetsp:Transcript_17881/g.35944  ORF Transcript_17881/g.35944 Transcript_17881/m.35944 type:complete len:454 (+) Transcript_17881:136-1497(+)
MIRLLTTTITLLLFLRASTESPDARSIQILNESGRRVDVSWIHPQTEELVLQSTPDVLAGASFSLNSFVSHSFLVREMPGKKTGECEGSEGECRVDYFSVNENHDQVILIKEGIEVEHTDSKSIAVKSANTLLDECKSKADRSLKNIDNTNNPVDPLHVLDTLTACVQKGVATEIERANEEIAFQAQVRKNMASQLENYTCADETLNTTEAKRTETWRGRKVSVMIDRPASKIHTVENFLTEDECKAVEEAARPILHDATVADGSGGSHKSDSRKAKQAGIKVHWDKEADGDLIARLSRRVYDYVNHVLPFDIMEDGQEDLMSIQYFGRGPEDEKPDRYMPHCDGDCNGMLFKPGNRMATIVMYCEIPKLGGATRFRNSNVHIKPKQYAATFFSYIDSETMKMDDGFTEHSGCPVVEGEKKIVTQWVRLGVDKENPWNSFNTLGIKYTDAENQ